MQATLTGPSVNFSSCQTPIVQLLQYGNKISQPYNRKILYQNAKTVITVRKM